ncbi:MAG: bifunctional folylpolyglutamate synthase/dihydrofolate synthase [Bacteroidales bacterium]|nr:bifunctional folylpolyglutamate synthase/dihydrofolate synthase [Bacteroidales bacterium]
MNYKETLNWLFNQLPMYQRQGKAAYKANLENTLELDQYFNHPHKNFKTIHVAGTNGKGSVSHMLASVLQTAGYKVGLYTSPHLRDFRERIKVNGKMVSEEFVTEFVSKHKAKFAEISPSFFEMTVAMAFDYFREQSIEIAIVEVGMGGRLDSTNIVSPDLSIITNIGLDHTAFLGNIISEIAIEKAGIIKHKTPIVIGQTQKESKPVFKDFANKLQAPIYFADEIYSINHSVLSTDNKQIFNIKGTDNKIIYPDLKLELLGNYQKKNILTVIQAINILNKIDYNLTTQSIYEGLSNVVKNTGLLGRWQILNNKPLTICDTGHNQDGISDIIAQIQQTAYEKLHMVFGVVDDKNIDTILSMLPKNAKYYFTKAQIPRALNEKILQEKAKQYNLNGDCFDNVEKAVKNAKKFSNDNDLIFIGGSTFIVAEVV